MANRSFQADAGKQAAARLAALLFDRGEYDAAATWYARLVDDRTITGNTDSRIRAAFSLAQSGDREAAAALLDSIAQQPSRPAVPIAELTNDLSEWILRQSETPVRTPELENWLTLYGTAAHVGVAPAGEPLLLERWSQPLTGRFRLDQRIGDLLQDLADEHRACIPAGIPILAEGKVAFRTWRGLAVADIRTGRMLWENNPALSAEALITNEPQQDRSPFAAFRGMVMDYGGINADHNPLTSLLFRDAVYGLLSSDGTRVFSIENSVLMPPPQNSYFGQRNGPADQDPLNQDWASNQIHAYDLATGELLWETGGRKMNEPFDPPLAGVFFFGPPVADGEELFVVGVQDTQISLYSLSPKTGAPLWSQSIGGTDTPIDRDMVRRLWSCTPAVDGGRVICPTATGWLVAINRHTHGVEWAHRFVEQPADRSPASGYNISSPQNLNERWCPSAPIVSNDRVYLTPSELPDAGGQNRPQLICVDSRTGSRLWTRDKGNSLYLGGVFDGRPLVVGRDEVILLDPADGSPVWTVPIDEDAGPPSGRGIVLGNQFFLPLHSGQLWAVNLSDGSVETQSGVLEGAQTPALGNLAVWQGTMLSLSPRRLVGFEQRAALQQEIDSRLARDPHDLWSAVKQAEMHAIAGEHADALRVLTGAATAATDDSALIERRRRLMFESLMTLLRQSGVADPSDIERAAGLAELPDEQLELERLLVRHAITGGSLEDAFDRCQQLADRFPPDQMVDDGATSLRLDVWLGGRMAEIAAEAPPELADAFAERVASLLESSSLEFPQAASLERMYGFHPAGEGFVWRLIEDAAYRKDFAGAELRLRRLIADGEPDVAAAALARLGEICVEFGQRAEAAAAFARLDADYGEVLLPSLKTGSELARDQFASGVVTRTDLQPPAAAAWSQDGYRVTHHRVVNSVYGMQQPPVTRQFRGPFFRRHLFELDAQSSFMTVRRQSDNALYWRVPLRSAESPNYNRSAVVFGHDLQAVVSNSGVIHALSLPDRRILWTQNVSQRDARVYTRGLYDNTDSSLHSLGSFAARVGLTRSHSQTGVLAVANRRYVACHGRGEFTVLDALTGEVLWRRRGVERGSRLIGDARILCVVPDRPSESGAYALNALDGSDVDVPNLSELLRSTVAITNSGFIQTGRRTQGRQASRSRRMQISAFDPLRGETNWSHEFDSSTSVTFIDDAHLFVLDEKSGACSVLDLETGSLLPVGEAPAERISRSSERYAVADGRQVYLVLNDARSSFGVYIHPPALRTNGTILAFARDGTGRSWQQTVENQNLLLPGFEQSPLLVFLAYDHVHLPEIEEAYAKSRLIVLNKSDGRVEADDVRASPNGNYYRIDVDPRQRTVDIHSHNERVRIEAAVPEKPDEES